MLFASGRRLLSIASLVMLIVAGLHTVGQFAPDPVNDAQFTALDATMTGYHVPLGLGMSPSMREIFLEPEPDDDHLRPRPARHA